MQRVGHVAPEFSAENSSTATGTFIANRGLGERRTLRIDASRREDS